LDGIIRWISAGYAVGHVAGTAALLQRNSRSQTSPLAFAAPEYRQLCRRAQPAKTTGHRLTLLVNLRVAGTHWRFPACAV